VFHRPPPQMKLLRLLIRFNAGLHSRLRNYWFRALGVQLEGYVWMRRVSIPRQWQDISLGKDVCLDDGVVLLCSGNPKSDKLIIGYGTYVNRYTMIDVHHQVEIGRNCMIGPHCYITDSNHGVAAGVPVNEQPMESQAVIIEDEVWLGAHVTVLPGVRLGRGAVVGAGAVVTKDIPPDAVAVGTPARQIGHRGVKGSVKGMDPANV
jgi:acetyltransferase-like isoleucine patch superfamily enzyme